MYAMSMSSMSEINAHSNTNTVDSLCVKCQDFELNHFIVFAIIFDELWHIDLNTKYFLIFNILFANKPTKHIYSILK